MIPADGGRSPSGCTVLAYVVVPAVRGAVHPRATALPATPYGWLVQRPDIQRPWQGWTSSARDISAIAALLASQQEQ